MPRCAQPCRCCMLPRRTRAAHRHVGTQRAAGIGRGDVFAAIATRPSMVAGPICSPQHPACHAESARGRSRRPRRKQGVELRNPDRDRAGKERAYPGFYELKPRKGAPLPLGSYRIVRLKETPAVAWEPACLLLSLNWFERKPHALAPHTSSAYTTSPSTTTTHTQ